MLSVHSSNPCLLWFTDFLKTFFLQTCLILLLSTLMGATFLYFLLSSFSIFISSTAAAAFTPQDNYLIICGSNARILTVDNRHFVGDFSDKGSAYLSQGKGFPLINPNPSPILYGTARVFTSPSSYAFEIKNMGTQLVRFHFSPFTSGNYDLRNGKFSVSANGVSILSNFGSNSTVIKEFFLMVDEEQLEILFSPGLSFAYVNAIEVFSAPKDFFIDTGGITLISPNGIQEFKQNISSQVLETLHRINVGGPKLTSFNDTLWRTWIPDEDFLVLRSAAKRAQTSAPPNYQPGGATRESAPDNVYMTAQQMNLDNHSSSFIFNITWDFPVAPGDSTHFIRLHFCDIVSIALNTLYFNVFINGVTAYKDVDLSVLAFHQLASPYYIDFVVSNNNMKDSDNVVRISVGPSELSSTSRKNAILNGVEIMRMLNSVPATTVPKKKSVWILVGSVVGGLVFITLLFLAGLVILRSRKRKRKPRQRHVESAGWTSLRGYGGSSHATVSEGTALAALGPYGYYGLKIPFTDLQSATNNFDESLIIGSGGFGTVYKGILKDNNIKVAVKRGVSGSRQGLPEFQTEITVLSKIRHHHLVSLVGYCEEQSEMILVYEYMENGPLRHHLYGTDLPTLPWKQRLEICIGAARGLHYLHTGSAQGIIHRDIKSTNILLDENYVAKVADFGLSRSGPCLDETHVTTGVKGSFGYLDPEYFRRQHLTDKSDVYSFGVVLLEVLCARAAVDLLLAREQVNLAEWVMEWQKRGMIEQIMDPHLAGQIKPISLKKFGEMAEKCLADYGVDRPTMGDVLWNLEQAYQLQITESQREERDENADADDPWSPMAAPRDSPAVNGDSEDAASDISTSRVFSQLITSEGR